MTMNLLPLFHYSVTPYGYDDENGQNKKFCTIGTQLYLDRNIIRAIRFYHFFPPFFSSFSSLVFLFVHLFGKS